MQGLQEEVLPPGEFTAVVRSPAKFTTPFLQVLESRTPNGTPGGTPVASPEKRAPRSPNKMAAARKDVVGVQCFKCQAWFESADDAYLIHVGECDAEVNFVEIINKFSLLKFSPKKFTRVNE